MYKYDDNTKEVPVNIVGSSVFGRYPKISTETTTNMFQSDTFLVPYSGYIIAIPYSSFQNGTRGRGIFTSTRQDVLIVVVDGVAYNVTINFNQSTQTVTYYAANPIGSLSTTQGVVYIAENNSGQILISDNTFLYVYQPNATPLFQRINPDFTPGYVTFHENNFICAAQFTNTWRLSPDGITWTNSAAFVGALQTKPDLCQAVVRFPSKGNMIFVMGKVVTESWFATGAQLFPYQRNNQFNIDYGCVSPATVAYMDEIVVWLAQNEKSGPVIMYSTGGMPQKITTDGIDYLFSNLQNPEDSEGFIYRQDGHLFYHINFYTDNLSLFYDFNTDKFYNATDQNSNYFIAGDLAFFNNQYYFVSRNTGNMYAFDTIFTTYQDTDQAVPPNVNTYAIPRSRICSNIRGPGQEYFVLTDIGFTIESGETPDYEGNPPFVELSLSFNGGATFGNSWSYNLPELGLRKNRLMWWQCGVGNDIVPQFVFWNTGRVVITNGVAHTRE